MVIERSHSPPASKRRYDSIAILLQGDDVCGASCFDGKKLLLANNTGKKTELVDRVLICLKKIAQKCSERLEPSFLAKSMGQLKSELLSYARTHVKLFQQNKIYATRFESALDKVTHSIKQTYRNPDDPVAFSFKMAEVMRKGLFNFLEKKDEYAQQKMPHAELQIVDYLYSKNTGRLSSGETVYIGVSKKCCGNCEAAMIALNAIMKSTVVTVRGEGHGFHFLGGIPEFLRKNEKIKNFFLGLREVDSLESAFVNDSGKISGDDQLLTPSSSMYDSSAFESASAHDSFVSYDEESSEVVLLNVSSTAKTLKTLRATQPASPAPRSPQKPKAQSKSKEKNKKAKLSVPLNAQVAMFTLQDVKSATTKKMGAGGNQGALTPKTSSGKKSKK